MAKIPGEFKFRIIVGPEMFGVAVEETREQSGRASFPCSTSE
jgi:hypothetical protein